MPPPRFRFSVRAMMIAVALAAVAYPVVVKVTELLERRGSYLDAARLCDGEVARLRARVEQSGKLIAITLAQIQRNEPPSPGCPWDTNDWRREYVEIHRASIEVDRNQGESQARQAEKFRRVARRPWTPLEGYRP